MALVSVHFDGPIVVNHHVSVRVLARTYEHLQRAIDRAYLINTYGDVYKHARLTSKQYKETEFLAAYPREGGIILDAMRANAGPIVDRIFAAIRPVFDIAIGNGLLQHSTIAQQFAERQNFVAGMGENTPTFEHMAAAPPPKWAHNYSNRSVVKEVDQLVSQVTPADLNGSTVDITLQGDAPHLPMTFNNAIAERFHQVAAYRELGAPVIVNVIIRSLDRGNKNVRPSAKILNLATDREVNLICTKFEDAHALHPHHNTLPVRLYVSPLIEAMGFDLHGGDLVFLSVV